MSKFMSPATALKRVILHDDAPVGARLQALRQLQRPQLVMLRRLLHRSLDPSRPLVPSRLLAAAALAYAREVALRKVRPVRPKGADNDKGNALGI